MTTCPRCPNTWTGLNTAHCTACHQTFTGPTAFDRHRTGNHAAGTRTCLNPETIGLVNANRPYPCWALPGTNNAWNANLSDETALPGVVTPDTPQTSAYGRIRRSE